MTREAVNDRLAGYGLRVVRVAYRGRIVYALLAPGYDYWWGSWRDCARDMQEVAGD